jgi:hypothetical protein
VLSLFGMMNWIYTWYNPQIDPDSEELADQIADMFLRGVLGERTPRKPRKARVAAES